MSRRATKVGLSVLAVAMMLGAALPAHASKIIEVEFWGKAKLAAPVGYPGLGINKGASIPFQFQAGNKVKKNQDGDPSTDKFTLCEVVKVTSPDKDKDKDLIEAPECGINASGTVNAVASPAGPWCGLSTGSFTGTIRIKKDSGNKDITVTAAVYRNAGALTFNGTASSGGQNGTIDGAGVAAPDATQGQSCATGATKFIVSGTFTIVLT